MRASIAAPQHICIIIIYPVFRSWRSLSDALGALSLRGTTTGGGGGRGTATGGGGGRGTLLTWFVIKDV